MGVEPTICLLAKQMPLPHSSHGPVKMNDDINYTIRNRKTTHLTALIHSATSRIVRVEGFEPSVPPSCLNLGMAQVPTHTTWAFSDEWDVRSVKLVQDLFSKVTCVLLNQTHEWGFISRLVPKCREAIHAVGYAAPWVRCSPQLSPTRSWDFTNALCFRAIGL